MMDAKGVRNMQSILVVVNKHNTAIVASCWFIIYYIMNAVSDFRYDVRHCRLDGVLDRRKMLFIQLSNEHNLKMLVRLKYMQLSH